MEGSKRRQVVHDHHVVVHGMLKIVLKNKILQENGFLIMAHTNFIYILILPSKLKQLIRSNLNVLIFIILKLLFSTTE